MAPLGRIGEFVVERWIDSDGDIHRYEATHPKTPQARIFVKALAGGATRERLRAFFDEARAIAKSTEGALRLLDVGSTTDGGAFMILVDTSAS